MKSFAEVVEEAMRLVTPSPDEEARMEELAQRLLDRANREAGSVTGNPKVLLGGSYAKETWVSKHVDIDIFAKFPMTTPLEEFERDGIALGLRALEGYGPYLRYSDHPYVEAVAEGVRVNMVPCYDAPKGVWKSAADRSPYHVELVKSSLDHDARAQARLLKAFMRGLGIYGAELRTQGFSGYVCEILVMRYGSFRGVLKEASSFRDRELIALRQPSYIALEVFDSPLIILDPVDEKRDLGTAISADSVARLIQGSRTFLRSPSIDYFMGASKRELRVDAPTLSGLLALSFRHSPRSPDILWGQLRRSMLGLVRQMKRRGFAILNFSAASNERDRSVLLFLLHEPKMSPWEVRVGPRVTMKDAMERFIELNSASALHVWFGEGARAYALVERPFPEAAPLMMHLVKDEASGIAPGLKEDMSSSAQVYEGREAVEKLVEPWASEAMTKLVSVDNLVFGSP